MNKPKEVDYTSHVAYTRALEAYCAEVEAELAKAALHIKHIGNDALRAENAELRAKLAKIKQQEPVAIFDVGVNESVGAVRLMAHTGRLMKSGDKLYLAAGAQPKEKGPRIDLGRYAGTYGGYTKEEKS
jgi:hypothetical protein